MTVEGGRRSAAPASHPRLWGAGCAVVSLALALACGPRLPEPRSLPHADNQDEAPDAAPGVERVQQEDRPTLQVIRRRGDPSGALSVAIFPSGGSGEVVLLRVLLELRLRAAGWEVKSREHSLGLVLTVSEPGSAQARERSAAQLFEVLHRSVSPEEAQLVFELDPLGRLFSRKRGVSPVDLCRGVLGSEGAAALAPFRGDAAESTAQLEAIRRAAVVASRVGLAVVGSRDWVEQGQALQRADWRPSEPLLDSWDVAPATSVQAWEAARELNVALRVGGSAAALAAARSLRSSEHPLRARIAAISSKTLLEEVEVTLRPAGACLSLRLTLEELPVQDELRTLAELASVTLQELSSEANRSWTEAEQTLALLTPTSAAEAAALAAWTAVRSFKTGVGEKRIVEYRGPEQDEVSSAKLARAVEQTQRDWSERALPALGRNERGQGQLWVMVASPCTTRAESPEMAGQRTLFLRTVARQWGGRRGVSLQPWIDARGSGLVAHGPALRGESPEEHARRVARALGAALFGAPVDGRTLAAVRSEALAALGSDPGRDLLATVMGGEHAAMLLPHGTDVSLSTLSTADVERERDEFVRERLRVAALENGAPQQAQIAANALGQWLAPVRAHAAPCPATRWNAADPGQWTLETIDQEVIPSARIAIPLALRPEVGKTIVHLLQAKIPEAELSWWGAAAFGALVVRVSAAEELDSAVERVRLQLHESSESPPSEAAATAALRELRLTDDALLRFPAARLVQLWLSGEDPAPVTADEVLSHFPELKAGSHRVVRVLHK